MSNLQKYYGLSNMMIPKDGPRAVPIKLEFEAGATIAIDGLLVSTMGVIEFVQGVFIDNADNDVPCELVCGQTNQRIICPPFNQGYFTLLIPNPPNMAVTLLGNAGGETVQFFFYNVPIQSGVWYAST